MGDRERDTALRRAVELGQGDTRHIHGLAEQSRLLEAVLARGGIDDEQCLCGAPGRRRSITLRTFASSSIRFVWVQPSGGVDDHDVAAARRRGFDRVVGDGGRVSPALGADEVRARAACPDLELLLGRGTERVGGGEKDGGSCSRSFARACRSWSSFRCR